MNEPSFSFDRVRVVAFDCDGVLFDTRRANHAYYNRILNHFERGPLTPEQFKFVHMHTVDNALAFLFKDEDERCRAHDFRKSLTYREFLPFMEPESTLRPLLDSLRPKYRTAIATNRTDTMEPLLEAFGLTDAFDMVVCASDVPRPKPHPDSLLKILAHFAVEPMEVIYVGDSEVDEQAARAAGVPLVAYANESLGGVWHIRRLAELQRLLDGKSPSEGSSSAET